MKKISLTIGIIACFLCGTFLYINACTKTIVEKMEIVTIETQVSAPKGKVLVVYFTVPETDGVDASSGASRVVANGKLYGNTEYIANIISEATQGELFALKTVQAYPGIHNELVNAAKKEGELKARPELATHIKNLKDYDVIFVGYPNWWYDMPMPIYSFFEEYDFSGKTIIPFCTHGGSRFSKSVETIATLEKEAKVVKGPAIGSSSVSQARQRVLDWLDGQGLTK